MDTGPLKILAIDDNQDNLTTLKAVVRDAFPGAKVLTALNSRQGIELARAEDPDVIVLDIVMPGMDGFEVCRQLKDDDRLQQIPVVILTDLKTDRESRIKALEAGAEAFLIKPLDEVELTAQIRVMAKIKAANTWLRQEKERLASLVAERTRELKHELAERGRVEDALRKSQELLKKAQEIAHLGSWEFDLITDHLTWSDEVYRIFGLPPQDFAATNEAFLEMVHPDERAAVDAAYIESLREGKDSYEIEHRIVRVSTGEMRCVHEKCEHVRDESGKVIRSVGMVHDITERKRAEFQREAALTALRESEERYRIFIDATMDMVFVKDEEFRHLIANRPLATFYGRSPEDVIGKTDFELMPAHDATGCRASDLQAIQTQSVVITEEQIGNRTFETTKFPVPLRGGKTGVGGIIRDITERKHTEENLRRQTAVTEAINRVLQGALHVETDAEVARICLSEAEELTGSKFGWIGEVNPSGRLDTIALSDPGWDACAIPGAEISSIKDMEIRGIFGRVLKDGKSLITNEPGAHPDRVGLPSGHPELTAFLGVPLKQDDRTIGMIALGNKLSGYAPRDQEAIEALSVALVEALQRKRAEEALRHRAEELALLQTTVLEITAPHDLPILLRAIVERATRLLNAPGGGLYLCHPDRREVGCVVSYNTPHDYTGTVLKYGEGAAGVVAQTGQPLIIDDYRTWRNRATVYEGEQPFTAVLSAPMIWQDQVTGVIHVLHDTGKRTFTRADLELLTLFANHAAVAVENARLYDAAQQEIAERKRAEERFRSIAQSANDAIVVADCNRHYRH